METQTCWVRPPAPVQGLDHLGTHAPCIELYSRLLPGITNVTDRARYYSIYPWFIWAFDHRHKSTDAEKFETLFRRADCLLTLISEWHSRCTDQRTEVHSTGMIGRQKLVPALAEWESTSRLSTYATREDTGHRYFQNRLGGLGQYYLGTLRELQVLDVAERGWIKYTRERGQALAEAVDRHVDGDRFFEAIESDQVSLDQLASLSTFCFCRLPHSRDEHAQLTDLLLGISLSNEGASRQRRLSLGVVLSMVLESETHAPKTATLDSFESAVYGRSFGARGTWDIPSRLESCARAWALYVRNDLLSIAAQAIFAVALKKMLSTHDVFASGKEFSQWFQGTGLARKVAQAINAPSFDDAKNHLTTVMAAIGQYDSPEHEWTYSRAILDTYTETEDESADEAVLTNSVKLLAALAARAPELDAYAASPFPVEFLGTYPINLQSHSHLARGEWANLPITELLGWLADKWGIETHLSIALRKLRYNPQSTFRVRPTDQGLKVIPRIPPPTRTNPRMRQGLQMLRDLGAIEDDDDHSMLTAFGRQVLTEITDGQ
jgi:hypothetical protein